MASLVNTTVTSAAGSAIALAVTGGNDLVDNILLNLLNQSGSTVLNIRNNGALYGTAGTFSGDVSIAGGLLDVTGAGTQEVKVRSTDGHASIQIDRKSTLSDASLMLMTNNVTKWRFATGVAGNDEKLSIYDDIANTSMMTFKTAVGVGVGPSFGTAEPRGPFEIRAASDSTVVFEKNAGNSMRLRFDDASDSGINVVFEAYAYNFKNHAGTDRIAISSTGAVTIGGNLTINTRLTFSGGSSQYLEIGTNSIALKNSSGSVLWSSSTSGDVDGSGTDHYIPRWNGTTTLQDSSIIALDSGSVGIGTIAPSEVLEVKGNITIRGETNNRLKIANDSNNNWAEIGNDGATGENTLEFFTGSSSTSALSINNGGYPAFAYASQVRLTLGSTGTPGNNDANWVRSNGANLEFNAASGDFNWEVAGAHKMRLTDTGFLGLGLGSGTDPFGTVHGNGTNGAIFQLTRTSGSTTGTLGIVRFGNTNIDSNLINIQGIQDGATDSARLEFQTQPTGGATLTRMTISSAGVVSLTTAGNTQVNNYYASLIINNTGSGTWSRLRFDRSGVEKWGVALGTDDTFRISNLFTSGTAASPNDNCFVINNSSNVGINVASPGYKLDVQESSGNEIVRFQGANSGSITFRNAASNVFRIYAGASDSLGFSAGNSYNADHLTIASNGSVGIGTASPGSQLHVYKVGVLEPKFQSSNSRVGLQLAAGNTGDVNWILYSGYPAAGDFNIRESGVANHLIIKKTTGSVGIGIDSPTSNIHVGVSGADKAAELRLDGTNGSSQVCGFIIDSSGATGNVNFKYNIGGGTPSTRMIMNTAGLKLPASHYLYFEDGNTYLSKGANNSLMVVTSGGWLQIAPQNSSFCHFMTDRAQFYFNVKINVAGNILPYSNNAHSCGASNQRFTNVYSYGGDFGGSVGIGTVSPETKLHVEGSSYTESSIKMERSGSGTNEDAGLIFSKSSSASDGQRLGGIYFGHTGTNYALIRAEMDASTGGEVYIVAAAQTNAISNTSVKTLQITAGTTTIDGTFRPRLDSSYTLGQTSLRWSHLYVDAITCGGAISGTGASITSLSASNLSSGTVATARLGSGTASSSTYLRGDGTWATVSGGGGDTVSITTSAADILSVSSGAISAVDAGSGDRMVFWDNGSNKLAYLDNGDGLSFSGTNLVVTGRIKRIYKGSTSSGTYIYGDSSDYISFYEGTGIGLSFSGNSITFSSSTGSDYRLKKNISTFNSEAWTKVKSVNLRKFDFDEDAFKTAIASPDREITEEPKNYTDNIGFIAHELAEAGVQGSVIGAKDAVDEDGNFIYQKVNYIALVPVLWGALKEAISKIETLESKVQALEDK